MHVTTAASDLSAALKHSVASRNSTLEVLQHALLTSGKDVLHIETTDTEIYTRHTIPAKVETAGSVCLTEALLRSVAGAAGEVVLRDTGKVSRGRSHFTLGALTADHFPTAADHEFAPLDIDPVALREAIKGVDYAYEDKDVRPYVRALHVEPGRVWSTNGNQMGRVALAYEGPAVRVPGAHLKRLVAELVEGAEVSVANVAGGLAGMLRVSSPGAQVTVRCIDAGGVDVERYIPHLGKRSWVTLNRRALMDALRRVLPFLTVGAATAAAKRAAPTVRITVDANGVAVATVKPGAVEHIEDVAPGAGGCGPMELGLDASYLLAALGAIDTDQVELYPDASAACVMLPAGADQAKVAHVLMPCRLPGGAQ